MGDLAILSEEATAIVDAPPPSDRKRVVIVGGGFAGLAAVHALRHADAELFLIDRRNHHIFQPLLYQVATAVLSPADIAAPTNVSKRGGRCGDRNSHLRKGAGGHKQSGCWRARQHGRRIDIGGCK
jgi:hypothetical protein